MAQDLHHFQHAAPLPPTEPFLYTPSLPSQQPTSSSHSSLSSSHLLVPGSSRRCSDASSTRSSRTSPYPELHPRSRDHSPNSHASSPRTACSSSAANNAGHHISYARYNQYQRVEPRPLIEPVFSYEEHQADFERRKREEADFYAVSSCQLFLSSFVLTQRHGSTEQPSSAPTIELAGSCWGHRAPEGQRSRGSP